MCPPFGSDETIMAYVMPLGWGHPPHQFSLTDMLGLLLGPPARAEFSPH